MIDCSLTKNYIEERERMCKTTKRCEACSISSLLNKRNVSCAIFERKYPEESIRLVQKWSNEHPIRTRLTDFNEKYPNAPKSNDGLPLVCCTALYGKGEGCIYIDDNFCELCWNQPI